MSKNIEVIKAVNRNDLDQVWAIRRKVFVDEQHCPAHLEYAHEEESTHFLALYEGKPCGAARWRHTGHGYKLERFAVLPAFRSKGVGAALLKAILDDLPMQETKVYLNAQLTAVSFYAPFGFKPVGEKFEEAGIMHQQMVLASGKKT